MNAAPTPPAALDDSGERDVARARAATASFRTLDSAVAAGYPREVRACLSDPAQGGMGFHHLNRALLDDKVDIERPAILLYSRRASGEYHLNGVEYIVLYSARPRDAQPLMVMGQQMKRSDSLKIWYLHVWLWEPNSSGLFADYNPVVKC